MTNTHHTLAIVLAGLVSGCLGTPGASVTDQAAFGTSKACGLDYGDCICPKADPGMRLQAKLCTSNLTCGGSCTYVKDDGLPGDKPDGGVNNAPDGGANNAPDGGANNAPDGGANNAPDGGASNAPDAASFAPGAASNAPDPAADLVLPVGEKKCVVRDGDCTCPAPDDGMKVQDTVCEGNTLRCGMQGFCTYVRATAAAI